MIALPFARIVALLLYAPHWKWHERRSFAPSKDDLFTNARPVLVRHQCKLGLPELVSHSRGSFGDPPKKPCSIYDFPGIVKLWKIQTLFRHD